MQKTMILVMALALATCSVASAEVQFSDLTVGDRACLLIEGTLPAEPAVEPAAVFLELEMQIDGQPDPAVGFYVAQAATWQEGLDRETMAAAAFEQLVVKGPRSVVLDITDAVTAEQDTWVFSVVLGDVVTDANIATITAFADKASGVVRCLYRDESEGDALRRDRDGDADRDPGRTVTGPPVIVSPNPVRQDGEIVLRGDAAAGEKAAGAVLEVGIYDLRGRLVHRQRGQGGQDLRIGLGGLRLAAGVYLVQTKADGQLTGNQKLTVIR